MSNSMVHQYIVGFVPICVAAIVFVTQIGESTDRITKSVDDLTNVVEENTKRGVKNSQDIAVLDNKVGYLEVEVRGR